MNYQVLFSEKFKTELPNYPEQYQKAIFDFVQIYRQYGLQDFNRYKGKIKPSFYMVDKLHPNYDYAFRNKLWHYHLGLPQYRLSRYGTYHTSDIILHFSKISNHQIKILTITDHYKVTGEFWLPSEGYLL